MTAIFAQADAAAIPLSTLVDEQHDYRIFAVRIPANDCYVERLLVFALPGATDERIEIAGSLTAYIKKSTCVSDCIDWIEVNPEHRRRGLATRIWNAAENILGRKFAHMPVTKEGRAFAESFPDKKRSGSRRAKR